MKISDGVFYVGVNDHGIDLFEGQYTVPNGMSYNSYVIVDEKTAVMDSVDAAFTTEWLHNIERVLEGRLPDYLIVQHMEPDHSANVAAFMDKYPNAAIVASPRAFVMMKNYFGTDYADRRIAAEEGGELLLGKRRLRFIDAPMVHWPEVILTYDEEDKILFSADAFGKFGALDIEEEWACEARRYYFGIVGKYGVQVQNLLKKISALDVRAICPLHGPVLSENLDEYIRLYDIWSKYGVESEGVFIAYTSVYGNTGKAVKYLAETLKKEGCERVVVTDLARTDMAEAVEDAFRYGKIVLATTTYNGEIFPFMRDFIDRLVEHNFQNKTIGFIENGSWAPVATRVMQTKLEKCKNLQYAENTVKILSVMTEENRRQIAALAKELCNQ